MLRLPGVQGLVAEVQLLGGRKLGKVGDQRLHLGEGGGQLLEGEPLDLEGLLVDFHHALEFLGRGGRSLPE